MSAMIVSTVLCLLSVTLVLADTVVTREGLRRGFYEVNPILSWFLKKFGSVGLAAARVAALGLILLVCGLLDSWEWVLFSSTFSAVMACVVLADVKKIYIG
jgi:hypothetical protein